MSHIGGYHNHHSPDHCPIRIGVLRPALGLTGFASIERCGLGCNRPRVQIPAARPANLSLFQTVTLTE